MGQQDNQTTANETAIRNLLTQLLATNDVPQATRIGAQLRTALPAERQRHVDELARFIEGFQGPINIDQLPERYRDPTVLDQVFNYAGQAVHAATPDSVERGVNLAERAVTYIPRVGQGVIARWMLPGRAINLGTTRLSESGSSNSQRPTHEQAVAMAAAIEAAEFVQTESSAAPAEINLNRPVSWGETFWAIGEMAVKWPIYGIVYAWNRYYHGKDPEAAAAAAESIVGFQARGYQETVRENRIEEAQDRHRTQIESPLRDADRVAGIEAAPVLDTINRSRDGNQTHFAGHDGNVYRLENGGRKVTQSRDPQTGQPIPASDVNGQRASDLFAHINDGGIYTEVPEWAISAYPVYRFAQGMARELVAGPTRRAAQLRETVNGLTTQHEEAVRLGNTREAARLQAQIQATTNAAQAQEALAQRRLTNSRTTGTGFLARALDDTPRHRTFIGRAFQLPGQGVMRLGPWAFDRMTAVGARVADNLVHTYTTLPQIEQPLRNISARWMERGITPDYRQVVRLDTRIQGLESRMTWLQEVQDRVANPTRSGGISSILEAPTRFLERRNAGTYATELAQIRDRLGSATPGAETGLYADRAQAMRQYNANVASGAVTPEQHQLNRAGQQVTSGIRSNSWTDRLVQTVRERFGFGSHAGSTPQSPSAVEAVRPPEATPARPPVSRANLMSGTSLHAPVAGGTPVVTGQPHTIAPRTANAVHLPASTGGLLSGLSNMFSSARETVSSAASRVWSGIRPAPVAAPAAATPHAAPVAATVRSAAPAAATSVASTVATTVAEHSSWLGRAARGGRWLGPAALLFLPQAARATTTRAEADLAARHPQSQALNTDELQASLARVRAQVRNHAAEVGAPIRAHRVQVGAVQHQEDGSLPPLRFGQHISQAERDRAALERRDN